jgi:hypothetical protein
VSRRCSALLVAVLALAGCGGDGGGERTAAAPNTANLWVAPTAGGAPKRCATPCAYDAAAAYGDFRSAYEAARPGDVVRVKAGRYGAQKLGPTNQDLDAPVTFQAAHGEKVRLTLLQTDADWLTFKDMTIAAGTAAGRGWHSTGNHVTLDHVDVRGPEATITIDRGADVIYRNANMGTPGNTTPRRCANHNSEPVQIADTTRLTIANVTFWPFVPELGNPICGPDGNLHLETIRINDNVNHLVIDRARFLPHDGSGSGRLFAPGTSNDVRVVNSYFGPTNGPGGGTGATITLTHCDAWVFAYNMWTQGLDDAACPVKPTYIGNIAAQPDYLPCPGSQSSHNLWVWSAAKAGCGSDRWLVHPDPMLAAYAHAADGYHLTATSPAIDAGEEELCRRYTGGVDIDGQRRKAPCDAGPDEYVP